MYFGHNSHIWNIEFKINQIFEYYYCKFERFRLTEAIHHVNFNSSNANKIVIVKIIKIKYKMERGITVWVQF